MTAISVIKVSKKNSPRCIKQTNCNTWKLLATCWRYKVRIEMNILHTGSSCSGKSCCDRIFYKMPCVALLRTSQLCVMSWLWNREEHVHQHPILCSLPDFGLGKERCTIFGGWILSCTNGQTLWHILWLIIWILSQANGQTLWHNLWLLIWILFWANGQTFWLNFWILITSWFAATILPHFMQTFHTWSGPCCYWRLFPLVGTTTPQ